MAHRNPVIDSSALDDAAHFKLALMNIIDEDLREGFRTVEEAADFANVDGSRRDDWRSAALVKLLYFVGGIQRMQSGCEQACYLGADWRSKSLNRQAVGHDFLVNFPRRFTLEFR